MKKDSYEMTVSIFMPECLRETSACFNNPGRQHMLHENEKKLLLEYKSLYEKERHPQWAFNFAPPIPFLGKKAVDKNVKVLVYGSAENLIYSCNQDEPINSLGDEQFFRHRYFFEKSDKNGDFPFVHIRPIEDGSLLTISRYILSLLGFDELFSSDPFQFVEEISVGNFCKFSIEPQKIGGVKNRNQDYAKDFDKLERSLEYVKIDLANIKPDILILPKTIYETVDWHRNWSAIKNELSIKNKITIVKIYQTNRRVINTHIAKQLVNTISKNYGETFFADWIGKSAVKGLERYLSWLDMKLDTIRVEL